MKPTPIHPGEVLLEEFLKPMGITQYALAKAIAVSPRGINQIVHGDRAITADTDLRLCKFFGLRRLLAARPSAIRHRDSQRQTRRCAVPHSALSTAGGATKHFLASQTSHSGANGSPFLWMAAFGTGVQGAIGSPAVTRNTGMPKSSLITSGTDV